MHPPEIRANLEKKADEHGEINEKDTLIASGNDSNNISSSKQLKGPLNSNPEQVEIPKRDRLRKKYDAEKTKPSRRVILYIK